MKNILALARAALIDAGTREKASMVPTLAEAMRAKIDHASSIREPQLARWIERVAPVIQELRRIRDMADSEIGMTSPRLSAILSSTDDVIDALLAAAEEP